ncbi:MAG: AAA family ATPase [bacterium]
MRKIAVINQKGGVGKTTTTVNLGAALAEQGRRVVVVDMDPQANLSLHLGLEIPAGEPSSYTVLHGGTTFAEALHRTGVEGLQILPSNIDLSGAELELASAIGRDNLISDAIGLWSEEHKGSGEPADYLLFDCPPSLGLLSINALAAANEVIITVQTEFLALMGMSKLVEVVNLIRRRLNPSLAITGIAPCLYDSRLKLAREVLGEIRKYFPGQVFRQVIRNNVKLAEAPSFGASIIEYAPESNGAKDYRELALEVISQEESHQSLAHLPPAQDIKALRKARQAAAREEALKEKALDKTVLTPKARPEAAAPPKKVAPPQANAAAPDKQAPANAKPVAPKQPAPRSKNMDGVDDELRVLRSQDLPPLPPEAFELPRS